ncbi:MAG: hypothetical protein KGI37_07535 [Alphaproteobacteria bacterium]|nr:hypothetical protein [Alphaproteobacteria bacterium]
MPAFNFTVNIAQIEDGTKLSTIRATKRCKIGDAMFLYHNQRCPTCRKLGESVCVGTAHIVIGGHNMWTLDNIDGDIRPRNQPLHEQEGFSNVLTFVDFFRDKYGLPFSGWLHVWAPL